MPSILKFLGEFEIVLTLLYWLINFVPEPAPAPPLFLSFFIGIMIFGPVEVAP